ncbi:MAG: hypothetical protein ACFE9R_06900 [Candidatus Hermodarchaeota archaeon]
MTKGEAWLNGSRLYGSSTVAGDVYTFYSDYLPPHIFPTTASYYGTHDWIGECAIDILYSNYPTSEFIKMLYFNTNLLKMFFLLGTEVPDSIAARNYRTVDTGITQFTKQWLLNKGCHTNDHSARFTTEGTMINTPMGTKASNCVKEARKLLTQYQDCQGAAFLLGVACHYIADAAFYPHLDSKIDTSQGSEVKNGVIKTTTRKVADWFYKDGMLSFEDPFFTHDEAKIEFGIDKPNYDSGYIAVQYAGYDVWAGKAITIQGNYVPGFELVSHKNIEWISQNYMNDLRLIWVSDFKDWKEYKEDFWDNYAQGSNRRAYLKAISHHLNVGVYYTAAVINNVKDSFSGCREKYSDEYGDRIQQVQNEVIGAYSFLFLFSWIGPFATIVTVTKVALGPSIEEMGSSLGLGAVTA